MKNTPDPGARAAEGRPAEKKPPAAGPRAIGLKAGALWLLLIAAVITADQLVKWGVSLGGGIHRTVIPGFMTFDYCTNTGAAFSLFENTRWVLVGVTSAMIAVCAWALFSGRPRTGWGRAALALIVAGGVSNLFDRAAKGFVVDFVSLHFGSYDFAVFNVADACVCVGAGLLCIVYLLGENRAEKRRRSGSE